MYSSRMKNTLMTRNIQGRVMRPVNILSVRWHALSEMICPVGWDARWDGIPDGMTCPVGWDARWKDMPVGMRCPMGWHARYIRWPMRCPVGLVGMRCAWCNEIPGRMTCTKEWGALSAMRCPVGWNARWDQMLGGMRCPVERVAQWDQMPMRSDARWD